MGPREAARVVRRPPPRAGLAEHDVFIDKDGTGRVLVRQGEPEPCLVATLLSELREKAQQTRDLLSVEEETLFKDYLCTATLGALHRATQSAEQLVDGVNRLLDQTPLGHQYYRLRPEPRRDEVISRCRVS